MYGSRSQTIPSPPLGAAEAEPVPSAAPASKAVAPAAPAAKAATPPGWLIGRWFDMFLVANLAWPLVVLGAVGLPFLSQPLSFVQIYLISTPHRWITLALVLLDAKHVRSQPMRFGRVAAALLTGALVLGAMGVVFPREGNPLIYLMFVDFVWNAWHFAAQHAGISRIYGRMAGLQDSLRDTDREKSAIRIFVLWTILRVAISMGADDYPAVHAAAGWLDPLALLAPAWLLWREGRRYRPGAEGRVLYLTSVFAMYGSILVALHLDDSRWLGALLLANAMFHAIEYLSIVGWSVRRKRDGVWAWIAPRIGLVVIVFALVLGLGNWMIAAWSLTGWMALTLVASYFHYAYDGMIWKSPPKKAPAPAS